MAGSVVPARALRLAALSLALLLAAGVLVAQGRPARSAEREPVAEVAHGPAEFAAGRRENLVLGPEGLEVGADASYRSRAYDDRAFGIYLSPELVAPESFDLVAGRALGVWPEELAPELEVRGAGPDDRWSEWRSVEDGSVALPSPVERYQYRLTLVASPEGLRPLVTGVALDLASSGSSYFAAQATAQNPTMKVLGTREGLVGRRTANGHVIVENDHFVALPSKRVLASNGGFEYQVRLTYKGKSVTVPVWDVGPWNTKDNYWDHQRELFGDLPRYLPQALAAWLHGYNNGRDQFGRWVTFPASIDIADGTFAELGMRQSDWVDVTFLWLNEPSPPPFELPKVYLKPEPATAPPPTGRVWYFAEGSTKPPFQTWLLLQNPETAPANATVTFMKSDGSQVVQRLTVAPTSRTSIFANLLMPDVEFSARIESDRSVYAERAVYFRGDGHVSTGVAEPSKTWYLAEGSSQEPFDTWILLQNPNPAPAATMVHYMKEDGGVVTQKVLVPPTARLSIYANQVVPGSAFSLRIEADRPIVAERAMYFNNSAGGGHASPAVPAPRQTWYLAEGNTRAAFDCWLLLQNPNGQTARASVTFLGEDGSTQVRTYEIGPTSRRSIYLDDEWPNARFGLVIVADRPLIAERSMYFGESAEGTPAGATNTVAAAAPARIWYLPEGSTQRPFQQYVLVANPNQAAASVTLEFMRDDGQVVTRTYTMPPTSRLTVDANEVVPDQAISTKVTADQPIVVERTMYFREGGTNTIGIPH